MNVLDLYSTVRNANPDYKCELEYILLRAGFFGLSPTNLFEFDICSKHYKFLTSIPRRNNCNICKLVFGEKRKSSSSGLRSVSKLIAVGLWYDDHLSTYDKSICTTCRLKLEKIYNENKYSIECEKILKWLYDPMILFTPEKTDRIDDESYYQSSGTSYEKKVFLIG